MKRNKLKTLLALVAVCLMAFTAQAQTNYFRVVNGTMHLPVFANTAAIATPIAGMMIYSTADAKILLYNGTSWVTFNTTSLPLTTNTKGYFNVVNGIPCLPVKAVLTGASVSGDMFYPTTGGGVLVNNGTTWLKRAAYSTLGSAVNATPKMGSSGTFTGGFQIPVLASSPAGVSVGAIYVSSTTKDLMFFDGATWNQVGWPNCPPQAEAVQFEPTNVSYGSVFNFEAGYSFYDKGGNTEGATITKWYIADDASGTINKTLKFTGTPYAYTYATADQNKYLSAAITPVASAGILPVGDEVFTSSFKIVACPPQGYAAIEGDFATCSVPFSVGAYSYYQKDAIGENTGALAYRWFLSTGAGGTGATTPLSTSASYTYTYAAADEGKYLNLGIIVGAVGGYPTSDESIYSGLLKNCVPQVSGVMVDGTLTVGQTLTAGYAYYDSEDNVEGTPSYQWYRDNTSTLIAGATAASYTLVAGDVGHTVGVAVTVNASAGNPAGTTANAFTAAVP
jgi:hypothetical protein